MKLKLANTVAAALFAIAGAGASPANAVTGLVDFEANPGIAQGPSIYVAVPGPQTIVAPEATFTGGVVLGFATFFPAIAFATAPNVYGTADFGNNLARSLTITMNPTFATNEVSFALFNGEVFNQAYVVNAFDGANLVATQTTAPIVPNFNSGYALIDVIAPNITSVTIAPTGTPAAWDFLIDTVAFNQSITNAVQNPNLPPVILPPPVVQPPAPPVHGHRHGNRKGEVELLEVNFGDDVTDIRGQTLLVTTPVPEPSEWLMMVAGIVGMAFVARRRIRKNAEPAFAA